MTLPTSADLLDRTVDLDAHEMAPIHFWRELFGDAAGQIADLSVPLMKKTGANDFYNPGLVGDLAEITEQTVWTIRGTGAPSAFDFSRRVEVLDAMGIHRQLIFPSFVLLAMRLMEGPDSIVRTALDFGSMSEGEIFALGRAGLDEYNDWAVRTTAIEPDRLRPVAYLAKTDSVEALTAAARHFIDRGIRALHIHVGWPLAGRSPADPELDPFWALLADRRVALTTHLGGEQDFIASKQWVKAPAFHPGKVESHEIGLEPHSMSTLYFAYQNFLTCMVLGGVFERHPDLRFGVIEAGASWFGPFAESLDMWAGKVFKQRLEPFITRHPSEYLASNVRVTPFNNFERVSEMFLRHPQLKTCYAYSTDFPHIEGGVDAKRKFDAELAPLGDEIRELFFVRNGELLLPD